MAPQILIKVLGVIIMVAACALWVCAVVAGGPAVDPSSSELHRMPLGLSVLIPTPADNPMTAEKVGLGRQLFFDVNLSRDGSVSCASCHQPDRAFTDGRALPVGIGGRDSQRNAPSLHNVAYRRVFFWDGRRGSLEEQALDPIANPMEMGNSLEAVIAYLDADQVYPRMFERAFGSPEVSSTRVSKAIASFERTLLSGGSVYDRYKFLGDKSALSERALRGLKLFMDRARCSNCHEPPLFMDKRFHNTGVSWGKAPLDRGLFEHTNEDNDRGKFRTPSLRDVSRTAPYMHDGSIESLEKVIEFYNRGGNPNRYLDQSIQPLNLDAQQMRDLAEFLRSLSGE